MKTPHPLLVCLCAFALPLPSGAWAQSPGSTDDSPHKVLWVAVEPAVRLEVLDWGGSGQPMVFLAGLGNTAHVFDDFAPRFRDRYHVYGLTRRGFGTSSHPAAGYDSGTRARDIVAVLDSLHIGRAILVGHSIAGDELSHVAADHPDRVRALIYLDAGFSYERDTSKTAEPPYPPEAVPPITAADSSSAASFRAYLLRRYGVADRGAELYNIAEFGPTGRLQKFPVLGAYGKVLDEVQSVDLRRMRAPALVIWASYASGAQRFPGYASFDEANRRMADAWVAAAQREREEEIARFRRDVPSAELVELRGANHYVFSSNAAEVERAMRAFLEHVAGPR